MFRRLPNIDPVATLQTANKEPKGSLQLPLEGGASKKGGTYIPKEHICPPKAR